VIYTATTVVLSVSPVRPVIAAVNAALPFVDRDLRGLLAIVAAMAVFFATNSALVTIALKLRYPDLTVRELFGGWDVNALELATLCLGALTAIVLMAHVYLVPLVVLPIVVLHRGVLMRQFQEAATTDHKTGVLNSVAWHDAARPGAGPGRRVRRADDRPGPLQADQRHARAPGRRLGAARGRGHPVRSGPRGGRGGPVRRRGVRGAVTGAALPDAIRVAERIRSAIADLTVAEGSAAISALSASIGVAVHRWPARSSTRC